MIKRLLWLVGRWARKPVNHTSLVAVVTPTDRPKSVRNRCLIELFCGVVCVVTLPSWHFCWCRGFCHRTESDLFLFLSINAVKNCLISNLFWIQSNTLESAVIRDHIAALPWNEPATNLSQLCTKMSSTSFSTKSVFGPELAYRLRVAQPTLMDVRLG